MPEPTLKILLDLLERFPLPLMLQTERGELIAQNQLWQQHCLSLHPLAPREIGRVSPSEMSDRNNAEGKLQLTHPRTHRYRQTQIGMDDQVESIWNLSYIPLGSFSEEDQLIHSTSRSPHQITDYPAILPLMEGSEEHAETEILWLVLAQNHTQEEQLTQDLAARNADLVQLNRLKDEFLACVTHELKTPLTAILGLSSLLKDQMLGTLNDRQSRYVQMIHQSGRQLMKVVNDILDLTRLETGQIELLCEPVSLRHVCDRAISATYQLHSQIKASDRPNNNGSTTSPEGDETLLVPPEKGIQLEIDPGLEWLVADEPRLRQMLINLLSNALKFTESDDKIGLRVNRWQNWVAFSVWDTGMGIPESKQALIFQKFQQLEHPLTRQFEGLGLGLVITQLLAQLHGGDVSFVSKEGEGSTFTILLPDEHWDEDEFYVDPMELNASPERDTNPSRELPILLIAHTQPQDLLAVQEQVGQLNFRVMVAHSGLEALEKTRRLQPAAIVLNPLLPLLSGQDVLTLLKTDPVTAKIPVILLGKQFEYQVTSPLAVDAPLSLPLNPSELQKALNQIFQTPQSSPPSSSSLLTFLRLVDREALSTLSLGSETLHASDLLTSALQQLMKMRRCQIVEVDDLDQAELLARIWKPQLILVETLTSLPAKRFLSLVRRAESLSRLPLISFVPALSSMVDHPPDLSFYGYDSSNASSSSKTGSQKSDPERVNELIELLQAAIQSLPSGQLPVAIR